ncbi:MAG: 50S ribosomal protein L28 [Rickettsiales bacterium]|jgi:large subunit ribosomal protein L28|nr:50S ribosomal protein L28 [Rickettsiales bacterium]
MSRRCSVTGTGSQFGNKVSHSNRKTRTRFLPNLQKVSLMSEVLGTTITLRVTAATLRSIEHNGGLDAYLTNHSSRKLTEEAGKLKRQIERKLAKKAAA